VCSTIDAASGRDPEAVYDLNALLATVARTIIVRAVFGNASRPELDEFGRNLCESVQRLLAHVSEFVMGRQSVPRGFAEAHQASRSTIGQIVDLLRDLDGRHELSAAQRAVPSVRKVLETAVAPDGADESLAALFLPLIIAGHETTGHTLSWALWEMAHDAELERMVLAEVDRFQAARGRGPLTTTEYDTRPVSLALLAETLRRHPPIQSVSRMTLREGVVPPDPETGIGGFRYPAGATMVASLVGVHLDPARWVTPDAFRLERWFEGIREGMSLAEKGRAVRDTLRAREQALDWIPFADGSSRCPGQYFSVHEFLLVLDALVPRYRFESMHPRRPVGHSAALVVGPEPGRMAVRIRPRRRSPSDRSGTA